MNNISNFDLSLESEPEWLEIKKLINIDLKSHTITEIQQVFATKFNSILAEKRDFLSKNPEELNHLLKLGQFLSDKYLESIKRTVEVERSDTLTFCEDIENEILEEEKKSDMKMKQLEEKWKKLDEKYNEIHVDIPKDTNLDAIRLKFLHKSKSHASEIQINNIFKQNMTTTKDILSAIKVSIKSRSKPMKVEKKTETKDNFWTKQYQDRKVYPDDFIDENKLEINNTNFEYLVNLRKEVHDLCKDYEVNKSINLKLDIINHVDNYIFTEIFKENNELDYLNMIGLAINLYITHRSLVINDEISLKSLNNEIKYYTNISLENWDEYINENPIIFELVHEAKNKFYMYAFKIKEKLHNDIWNIYAFNNG